ncbi:MAG: AhpC/TSA family protein [Armatimonadetes bacterium]|nr:redoxin domain-containing protein [Armatimonadota bacterium]MBS1701789.1 AhpC/TSA family protein [Armatimonadota bacterium]MBS1728693.1 AhpC/TSA family protein [Armatimonadota bacterium]
MHAPLIVVTLDSGKTRDLSEFYKDRPLVLVFLRHFGCMFCREQIAGLRPYKQENIVLVSMGKVSEAAEFKSKMEIPQTIISDPNKQLYEAFGLRRGSVSQIVSPTVARRSIAAFKAGHRAGMLKNDPWMMAGVFRVDPDGEVSFAHYASDIADNLPGEEIARLLRTK